MPWQDGIQGDWDGTGEADLASVSVAAQQKIEIGMSGLTINLRRMRKEN